VKTKGKIDTYRVPRGTEGVRRAHLEMHDPRKMRGHALKEGEDRGAGRDADHLHRRGALGEGCEQCRLVAAAVLVRSDGGVGRIVEQMHTRYRPAGNECACGRGRGGEGTQTGDELGRGREMRMVIVVGHALGRVARFDLELAEGGRESQERGDGSKREGTRERRQRWEANFIIIAAAAAAAGGEDPGRTGVDEERERMQSAHVRERQPERGIEASEDYASPRRKMGVVTLVTVDTVAIGSDGGGPRMAGGV
jgi:hypothetical protein